MEDGEKVIWYKCAMADTAPQLLFDRSALRRNRARWAGRFSEHNVLFEESAAGLAERLSFITRDFAAALEIGSRSSALARALMQDHPARRIIRMGSAEARPDCIGDEEMLPFAANSFDLIISNLGLHWANDLPGALIQIRRALKPDGFFLAALLGGDTLSELRASLYEAEMELRGGISPRVAPFMELRDGAALLQRAGFTLPVADRERLTFTYPDIFALMNELRFMGEANSGMQREKRFAPRGLFKRAGEIYAARFPAEDGGIKATFEILALSGWAAHDSQQKPLQPGAAKHSLAAALRTHEVETADSAAPAKSRRHS
jgi:SAM-dependent methyltransferase